MRFAVTIYFPSVDASVRAQNCSEQGSARETRHAAGPAVYAGAQPAACIDLELTGVDGSWVGLTVLTEGRGAGEGLDDSPKAT